MSAGTSPDLSIRIKKKTDGSAALSCVRADGTTTWQRQEGQLGRFFPLHDLTHYAVETVLGFDDGFYGLVASGWDFTDFGQPWPRGRVPAQGALTEAIVGLFDLERRMDERYAAEELNARIMELCADQGVPLEAPPLDEDSAARIRQRRAELFDRWQNLTPGDTLALGFSRSNSKRSSQ